MNDRFECLIDDNYRRLTGRLPSHKITTSADSTNCSTNDRFACLIEDSPHYRNHSKSFSTYDKKTRKPPERMEHSPQNRLQRESVNDRVKRLKESGQLQVTPYIKNKDYIRPRSNTTPVPMSKHKTFEEEFPSLNKIVPNSAPSTPLQNTIQFHDISETLDITNRLIIKELPLPKAKYVSIGLKNGKYFEREVYSTEDINYVPEPQVLVVRKPVYNKWTDLLNNKIRDKVYVDSLRNVYDRNGCEENLKPDTEIY